MKNILIQITAPWRRRLITLLFSSFVFFSRFSSSRARVHWIGRFHRRRRPERTVFAVLFLGTLLAAGSHRYPTWMTAWGGMIAIFLNLFTIYSLIPRKRYHWVKS